MYLGKKELTVLGTSVGLGLILSIVIGFIIVVIVIIVVIIIVVIVYSAHNIDLSHSIKIWKKKLCGI